MTTFISAQLGVGLCAASVTHTGALPRRAPRLIDLNGLNVIIDTNPASDGSRI